MVARGRALFASRRNWRYASSCRECSATVRGTSHIPYPTLHPLPPPPLINLTSLPLDFCPSPQHGANAGLDLPVTWLEPIKKKYDRLRKDLSYADLYTLGNAIYYGGPVWITHVSPHGTYLTSPLPTRAVLKRASSQLKS